MWFMARGTGSAKGISRTLTFHQLPKVKVNLVLLLQSLQRDALKRAAGFCLRPHLDNVTWPSICQTDEKN